MLPYNYYVYYLVDVLFLCVKLFFFVLGVYAFIKYYRSRLSGKNVRLFKDLKYESNRFKGFDVDESLHK